LRGSDSLVFSVALGLSATRCGGLEVEAAGALGFVDAARDTSSSLESESVTISLDKTRSSFVGLAFAAAVDFGAAVFGAALFVGSTTAFFFFGSARRRLARASDADNFVLPVVEV
jgi:hypothetical protein